MTVYCDFRDPLCDNWAESLETGWYTIAIAGTEPKTFCCSAHAIFYIRDPIKHVEPDGVETLNNKDGNQIYG